MRHLFEDPKTGCPDPARALTALPELRRLVLQAAELAKNADLARNRGSQARRHYTIITKTYFEGIPLDRVARELGVSMRQVYRERSSICDRIARFVWDHRFESQRPTANGFSLRDFELERARATAELGYAATALTILESLLRNSRSESEKAEITSILADVALSCGDRQLSRRYLTLTTAFLTEGRLENPCEILLDLVAGRLALVTAKLSRIEGKVKPARVALARAIEIGDRFASSGHEGARFFTDVTLERAACLCDYGCFQAAHDLLSALPTLVESSVFASPIMRAELQTLRSGYVLNLPRSDNSAIEQRNDYLDAFYESLSLARSCGSPRVAILTMYSIAAYHAYCGRLGEAHAVIQQVVPMARAFPNPRVRATSLLDSADVLCATPYRTEALKLLDEAERDLPEDSSERVMMLGLKAGALISQGAYVQAWQASLAAEAGALRLGNRRLLGMAWRAISLVEHARGRVKDATERIEGAIDELERAGSALSLVKAYRTAAMITRDERWRRRAKVLARQLRT